MFAKARRILYQTFHPVVGEVWQLHHVADNGLDEYTIAPKKLESLITEYRGKGYEFIAIEDILKPRKKKFVAVTLDDGYEDNFSIAKPLFERLNIPYCIFVASDHVFDEEKRARKGGMTPEQLREIAESPLCTIGAHTKGHCHLNQLSKNEQQEEIIGGKNILESFLGKKVDSFAYPYGDFNTDSLSILADEGFQMGFAAWGGPIRKGDYNDFELPRILK